MYIHIYCTYTHTYKHVYDIIYIDTCLFRHSLVDARKKTKGNKRGRQTLTPLYAGMASPTASKKSKVANLAQINSDIAQLDKDPKFSKEMKEQALEIKKITESLQVYNIPIYIYTLHTHTHTHTSRRGIQVYTHH